MISDYEVIKKIQEFNKAKKPIWFTKLCEELKADPKEVLGKLRMFQDWDCVKGFYGATSKDRAGYCYAVTWFGEDFIKFCEKTDSAKQVAVHL
jgi:hypothetical protein